MNVRHSLLLAAAATAFGLVACGDEPGASRNPGAGSGAGSANLGGGGAGMAGAAVGGSATAGSVAVGGQHTQAGSDAGVSGANNGSGGGGAVAGSAGSGAGTAGGSSCPISSAVSAWPGKNEVKTLDQAAQFQSDLSGLVFEPGQQGGPGVLWAVNNLSSTLFRLVPSGAGFVPDTANGWASGKGLRYPGGSGAPDSEGVTFGASVADGMYVCSEHDGESASTSRLSVLRYDVSGAGTTLTATREWNVTALLPQAGANTGLEGITWVPDTFLTAKGFIDEAKQHAYAPSEYPDHGTGLFFVGVEATGKIYGLALNHADGSSKLVATITTPNDGVMGLEFDRDAGNFWFNCDDGGNNQSGILDVDRRPGSTTLGHFVVRRQFQRPTSLPNSNNEGIAVAPDSECSGGFKRFFWTDDADEGGFSLRTDLIPCTPCP
ncbi:MAG TPA: hypothetical protein VHP33_15030 [Polyangiaceae bacterium]|nr:hypothetical protein [Polyangiaceae bacterium]